MSKEFLEQEEKELLGPIVDVDDMDNDEEDEEAPEIMRVPRSGKRQLTPIERLR